MVSQRARVTLAAVALGAIGVLASASFPRWVTPEPADAAEGVALDGQDEDEGLFTEHCAGCHELAQVRGMLRRSDDAAADAARLRAFLAGHGATDAAQDERLARLLLGGEGGSR
jgi:hypothetical protein